MITLGINTSATHQALALIEDGRVIAEKTWIGARDESEKLLPNILEMLGEAHYSLSQLSRIVAVQGPGPFSALRIGVTVANTLAYSLGCELYGLDTMLLWEIRTKALKPAAVLIHAGGKWVAEATKKKKLFEIDQIAATLSSKTSKEIQVAGELTQEERTALTSQGIGVIPESALPSFGTVLTSIEVKNLIPSDNGTLTPRYFRPPSITRPRHSRLV